MQIKDSDIMFYKVTHQLVAIPITVLLPLDPRDTFLRQKIVSNTHFSLEPYHNGIYYL